jgi:glycosyltransferase involved in cell wall biosynthesis
VSFLPSYTEGAPLVILESLASQVPVVASNVGGIPEILRDGVTGYLTDVEDTRLMADRIVYLLDHEEERRAMGRRGREYVKTHHDWGATTRMVEAVYRRLLGCGA